VYGSDLQRATDLATIMETSMGFGTSLVYHDAQDPFALDRLRRSDLKLKGRVDAILKASLKNAKDLISVDRQAVEAIAKHLVRHGSMPGRQVKPLIDRQRKAGTRRAAIKAVNAT
jgi:cell division protease FtsH